jgi:tripartite ATP-independent transporter DctP family solute receptor
MKRKMALCLATCVALSLTACGGSSSSTSTTAAPVSQAAVADKETTATENASKSTGESMTLRFATDSSEDYVSTVQIYKFADEVEEKTDGRIKIEVYAGAQLGDEASCIEQTTMGTLDFTKSSMGALAGFNDTLNLLSLPYLFKSEDHLWKVLDSDIGQMLLDSMAGTGLKGIGWLDAGSRCFYSKKPLETIDDFKGQKIRSMGSSIYVDSINALGASAISMAGSDVYSGLQTGVVDGAENNIPRIIDMSHNELCTYLLVDRHNIMPEMVLVSENVFNKLSAEDQAIIMECAKDLEKNMRDAWEETENEALKTLEDGGMKIIYPDDSFQDALREKEQTIYDQYGKEYADTVAAIEAMK